MEKIKSSHWISFLLFAHHILEFFLRKLPVPVLVISCKDCLNLQIKIIYSPVVLFHVTRLTCFWVNFFVVLSISCLVMNPSLFLSINLKAISAFCCWWDFSFSCEVSNRDTISALLLLRLETCSEKQTLVEDPHPPSPPPPLSKMA